MDLSGDGGDVGRPRHCDDEGSGVAASTVAPGAQSKAPRIQF